jgi:predicted metalloprotease with PDZ domain
VATRYQISFPNPGSHLVHVRLEFTAGPGPTRVWMPAWTPGSYLLREYARNIRRIAPAVAGAPVAATKTAKDTWEIPAPAGAPVTVDYTVYAHELSVRTAHHDATHAFLHPAQIFLLPQDSDGPYRVDLDLPPDWTAASLAADPDRQESRIPGRFSLDLPDLDTLLDTPIEAGLLHHVTLPAPCEHVRLAVWGEPLPDGVLPRLAAVVAATERTWPVRPYARYTFLVHAAVGAAGGLEHLHGSVLGLDPETLADDPRISDPDARQSGLHDFLELVAHELFHAWNGKRLRPVALGPFDYRRENYTRELWLVEGLTSYYDRLIVLRSREMPVRVFLKRTAVDLARLAGVPGRLVHSLADASFDAWIKLYRPQDDSPNASVSYYLKGALVAFIIDLWLRGERPDGDGLDAVLTDLWTRAAIPSTTDKLYTIPGFTTDNFIQTLTDQAGLAPPPWLRAQWDAPGELDLRGLATVGLHLTEKPAETLDLGLVVQDRGGAPWVQHVLAGGPAEAGGVAPGDELLAARHEGGPWLRLRTARAAAVHRQLRQDRPIELLIARRERVHTVILPPQPARGTFELERLADPDPAARTCFERWARRSWNDE